jgi:hypothetical protein
VGRGARKEKEKKKREKQTSKKLKTPNMTEDIFLQI